MRCCQRAYIVAQLADLNLAVQFEGLGFEPKTIEPLARVGGRSSDDRMADETRSHCHETQLENPGWRGARSDAGAANAGLRAR